MDARISRPGRDPKLWSTVESLADWGFEETLAESSSDAKHKLYTHPDWSSSTLSQTNSGPTIRFQGSNFSSVLTSPLYEKQISMVTYDQLLEDYLKKYEGLQQHVQLALDKFKFGIIASSIMTSTDNVDPVPENQNRVILDVSQFISRRYVHSHQSLHLALALLHFVKKNLHSVRLACLKLAVILSIAFLLHDYNNKQIAVKIYLQLAINKLTKYLCVSHVLDQRISMSLKTIDSGPARTLSSKKQEHQRSISPLLFNSTMNVLLLTTGSKLRFLLPFVDFDFFHKYLDIYQLDLMGPDFKFLRLVNSDDFYSSPKPSRLKPLRLRSVSSESVALKNPVLSQSSSAPSPNQLTTSPVRLVQCFKLLRKVFLCALLSLAENASLSEKDDNLQFIHMCSRVFGRNLVPSHLHLPTRLILIVQVLQQLISLEENLSLELMNDFQSHELDSLVPVVRSDFKYNEITRKVDVISNRLAALECHESGSPDDLAEIGTFISDLVESYNRLMECVNVPEVSAKPSPVVSPQMSEREFPPPKKRHSSGLNFNLITVFEGDAPEREHDSVETTHENQDKEEFKKTLEKLCAGNLKTTNETFDGKDNDPSLSMSTPIKTDELDEFKKELKGLLLNAL
ncbi:hypothetical protein OGAPHI_007223 [Ogataea philodendri]|uniref:Inheritance of peroxisomes protein 2 n=1 Tax=Ogataea philodendri TaxID=1378263 RepID=A0A9P8SYT5_9ASCO|nr:uncharacterized protein OGAPHI_007223 [Ogataea philodendri]KAH3660018.1 hypothetical protein OGAPHI_007223 [Ogataea philodendri]